MIREVEYISTSDFVNKCQGKIDNYEETLFLPGSRAVNDIVGRNLCISSGLLVRGYIHAYDLLDYIRRPLKRNRTFYSGILEEKVKNGEIKNYMPKEPNWYKYELPDSYADYMPERDPDVRWDRRMNVKVFVRESQKAIFEYEKYYRSCVQSSRYYRKFSEDAFNRTVFIAGYLEIAGLPEVGDLLIYMACPWLNQQTYQTELPEKFPDVEKPKVTVKLRQKLAGYLVKKQRNDPHRTPYKSLDMER